MKALTTVFNVNELFHVYTETVNLSESKAFLSLLYYAFKYNQFHGI